MSLLGKHLGRMLSLLFTPPYEDWRIFMVSIKFSLRLRSQRGKNLRTWMIYDLDMKSLLLPLLLLLTARPLRNSSCSLFNWCLDEGLLQLQGCRISGIWFWFQYYIQHQVTQKLRCTVRKSNDLWFCFGVTYCSNHNGRVTDCLILVLPLFMKL